ncbi:MAG: SDR family oxidoreductase [Myxococcales bacterium]|nr:SDR family oxidoreductase [Myxococcales bacterium]
MAKPRMCDPNLLKKDLTGKRYVVTGANSGIGFVTAKQLAKQGAEVIFACRNMTEANARIDETKSEVPNARAVAMKLDLGNLDSVRAFASEFLAAYDSLDGLVNNAGVMNTSDGKTPDGFELQFGINHLGHFLLTELLLPALKAGAPSRITIVSSCYHDKAMGREGRIDLDDLNFENRDYDGWEAYAQSKLANLLHAKELAKRLEGTGVTAVSVHPGWVRTNLAKNTMPVWIQNTVMRPFFRLMGMIEPWEGAQTTLYTLLADDVSDHSGEYYSQLGIYREKSAKGGGWPMKSPNPNAHDSAVAEQLYDRSAEMVGLA